MPPPPPAPAAPEVAALVDARDYSAAREAQDDYLAALRATNAPPALEAAATAELARLADLGDDPAAAVEAQRRALRLTKEAFGDEGAEAAEAHLDIVSYYLGTGEPLMAKAHYRQARKLLRSLPDGLTEARAQRLQQLGDRLGILD